MPELISAIIPTWNEAAAIEACVERCRAVADEIIVADAGSCDGTGAKAEQAGARVVQAPRGRGPQLNAGAAIARGSLLLFVHADTHLPPTARGALQRALRGGYLGGNFKLRFVPETRAGKLYAAGNHLRRKALRIYYGDSCIFVRRSTFQELGGFADLPLFEDHDFVRRLERTGRTHYETQVVASSSSRRFAQKPLRTLALWAALQTLFASGVSAHRLARLYADVR